nr:serine/threonine-protein kinase ATR-like [Cherax quadricarinatus]
MTDNVPETSQNTALRDRFVYVVGPVFSGGDETNILTLLTSLTNFCRHDEGLLVAPTSTGINSITDNIAADTVNNDKALEFTCWLLAELVTVNGSSAVSEANISLQVTIMRLLATRSPRLFSSVIEDYVKIGLEGKEVLFDGGSASCQCFSSVVNRSNAQPTPRTIVFADDSNLDHILTNIIMVIKLLGEYLWNCCEHLNDQIWLLITSCLEAGDTNLKAASLSAISCLLDIWGLPSFIERQDYLIQCIGAAVFEYADESCLPSAVNSQVREESSQTSQEKGRSMDDLLADVIIALQQHISQVIQIFKEELLSVLSKCLIIPNVMEKMTGLLRKAILQCICMLADALGSSTLTSEATTSLHTCTTNSLLIPQVANIVLRRLVLNELIDALPTSSLLNLSQELSRTQSRKRKLSETDLAKPPISVVNLSKWWKLALQKLSASLEEWSETSNPLPEQLQAACEIISTPAWVASRTPPSEVSLQFFPDSWLITATECIVSIMTSTDNVELVTGMMELLWNFAWTSNILEEPLNLKTHISHSWLALATLPWLASEVSLMDLKPHNTKEFIVAASKLKWCNDSRIKSKSMAIVAITSESVAPRWRCHVIRAAISERYPPVMLEIACWFPVMVHHLGSASGQQLVGEVIGLVLHSPDVQVIHAGAKSLSHLLCALLNLTTLKYNRDEEDSKKLCVLTCKVCNDPNSNTKLNAHCVDPTLVSQFLELLTHTETNIVMAVVDALPAVVSHTAINSQMLNQYLSLLTHQEKAVVSAICKQLPILVSSQSQSTSNQDSKSAGVSKEGEVVLTCLNDIMKKSKAAGSTSSKSPLVVLEALHHLVKCPAVGLTGGMLVLLLRCLVHSNRMVTAQSHLIIHSLAKALGLTLKDLYTRHRNSLAQLQHILAYLVFHHSEEEEISALNFIAVTTDIHINNIRRCSVQNQVNELVLGLHDHRGSVLREFSQMRMLELNADQQPSGNKASESDNGSSSSLGLDAIAEFLAPRLLGILGFLDSKLVSSSTMYKEKRSALWSLGDLLVVMGRQYVSPVSRKVLSSLKTALKLRDEEFYDIGCSAWTNFLYNLDESTVEGLLEEVIVVIMPLVKERPKQMASVLSHILIEIPSVKPLLKNLPLLPDDEALSHINQVIKDHQLKVICGSKEEVIEALTSIHRGLSHESLDVRLSALTRLRLTLQHNQNAVHHLTTDTDDVHPAISELFSVLLAQCREVEEDLRVAVAECLGLLGAIDPTRLYTYSSIKEELNEIHLNIETECFIVQLVTELGRAFLAATDANTQTCASYAMQEVTRLYGIRESGCDGATPVGSRVWERLGYHLQEIIYPLLTSKYTVATTNSRSSSVLPSPIYGSSRARSFHQWLTNWACFLVELLKGEKASQVFSVCKPILRRYTTTAMYLLPSILVCVLRESAHHHDQIITEILAVMSQMQEKQKKEDSLAPSSEFKHLAVQTVFSALDYLSKWVQKQRQTENIGKKGRGAFTPSAELQQVTSFLEKIPANLLAQTSFKCQAYSRALLHIEAYLKDNPDQLKEHLRFLQCIYVSLDEPDGVAGVAAIRREDPSLDEQVIEYEATGRLQDALGCYERLCVSRGSEEVYKRLLECYLSLDQPHSVFNITHGLLTNRPELESSLNKYRVEAAWKLGQWEQLETFLKTTPSQSSWGEGVGQILLAVRARDCTAYQNSLRRLRIQQITSLSAASMEKWAYQRAYPHILRFFFVGFGRDVFVERAKWHWVKGEQHQAVTTLNRGIDKFFSSCETYKSSVSNCTQEDRQACGRAKLLLARYSEESATLEVNTVKQYYRDACEINKQWEDGHFHLAMYYDRILSSLEMKEKPVEWIHHIVLSFGKSLQYGCRHIYQSMPRILSLWLEFGTRVSELEAKEDKVKSARRNPALDNYREKLANLNGSVGSLVDRLPHYMFVTALPQLISRICHSNSDVFVQLCKIIATTLSSFPQQSMWHMIAVSKSSYQMRVKRCIEIFEAAKRMKPELSKFISDATKLADKFLELSNKPVEKGVHQVSLNSLLRGLPRLLSDSSFSNIILPLQHQMSVTLPTSYDNMFSHNPYPRAAVYLCSIEDHVEIMQSLQLPKKITLRGSDGKLYIMMCKPKDDLRKDCRLMEFNNFANRCLLLDPESRKRDLHIRTYAVVPLNEECGLIEWIQNLHGLRQILHTLYRDSGIFMSAQELKQSMCKLDTLLATKRDVFLNKLVPRHPPVFATWFLRTFPDPQAWLRARLGYCRTTAVMSMVGYILGLGDRHGENILFDASCGDTVHVDFNCLFNKGESFDWPERVPFRLTHNMVNAMGPTGHEGIYRKTCEVTMRVMREKRDALMSVLRPFIHDPLVEWSRGDKSAKNTGEINNEKAQMHVSNIEHRLSGQIRTKARGPNLPLSVEGQVNSLIEEATNIDNLCQMYIGWAAYM